MNEGTLVMFRRIGHHFISIKFETWCFWPEGGMPMCLLKVIFIVQSLSCVLLFVTPWTAVCQVSLSSTVFWSLLEVLSIESMMPSDYLIPCHPFLLWPSIFPSIRVFSNESALHLRWPQYWSFNFSINPSNEYSRLTSFRIEGHNGREKSFQVLGIWWPFSFLCNTLFRFSPPCYNKAASAEVSDGCVSFTLLYL